MSPSASTLPGAMSIDLEDWFQVENLRPAFPPSAWDSCELRVEANVERMLGILAEQDVRATWFVLGWVARRRPALIRRIADAGHEIASHGDGHELVTQLTPASFRIDAAQSKKLLEDLVGRPVLGYRAPCFSITDWAIDALVDLGYGYDASVFPVTGHDRYGRLEAVDGYRPIVMARPGFYEVCTGVLPLGNRLLPWGGGGWFRLLPYPLFRAGLARIHAMGRPYVFYLHPWELDPGQPRADGLPLMRRWRHYQNLDRTETRWRHLLASFRWTTIGDLIGRVAGHRPIARPAAAA
jgi:polysaccharide deacetylase family protein (PEP-CTERM system associated)